MGRVGQGELGDGTSVWFLCPKMVGSPDGFRQRIRLACLGKIRLLGEGYRGERGLRVLV